MLRILDIWTDSTNLYNKESKHGTGYSERSIDGCPIPTLVNPYYEWTSGNMCIEFEKFEPTYTLVIVANSPNMRQDYCIPRPYNPFKYSTAHQPNTAEFDNSTTTTTHAIKSNRLCPQGRIVSYPLTTYYYQWNTDTLAHNVAGKMVATMNQVIY